MLLVAVVLGSSTASGDACWQARLGGGHAPHYGALGEMMMQACDAIILRSSTLVSARCPAVFAALLAVQQTELHWFDL